MKRLCGLLGFFVFRRLNWKKRVEDHEATRLTGSPAVHDGIVFIPAASWEETRAIDPNYACCTFRGSVTALRARDGSVVWKTYLIDPPKKTGTNRAGVDQFGPSGAGVWSAPTVDTRRGRLYITTGDNYSYPATTTSDAVVALDLKTGRIVWSQQTLPNDVYTSACGSRGVNCPPARLGCSPAQPGALSVIPGAVFSGSMDGHLRAFSTSDGTLLWDFDTARPFVTVNGINANGGSIDGAGAIISSGMIFINSGYPRFGGMPGNVLLAFGN